MNSRRAWAALALALAPFSGCVNVVEVVEEAAPLAAMIDRVEVVQDDNGDGELSIDESTFVVDPRPNVDKVIRMTFLLPVPRSAFDPPEGFIELLKGQPPAVEIESVYFTDPTDTSFSGVTDIVHFDITDDLVNTTFGMQVPVFAELDLAKLGVAGGPDEARFVFVVGKGPPAGTPPRIIAARPDRATDPIWNRRINRASFSTLGVAEGDFCANLDRVLARFDNRQLGIVLEDRPAPHELVEFLFDKDMANFVVSIDPEDDQGIRLRDTTIGFAFPIQRVFSETGVGLAPDTIYTITALSKYAAINVPIVSGTQDDTGLSLMPLFDEEVYNQLLAEGCSNDDLYADSRYRFHTSPVRIVEPVHLGFTNTDTAPGGVATIAVQFADPLDGQSDIDRLAVTAEFSGNRVVSSVTFSGEPDVIDQGTIFRDTNVLRDSFTLPLPATDFDDEVTLTVTARSGGGAFLGRDTIRFMHDVIAPTIEDDEIAATNKHVDGRLEELCIVADCDVEQLIIQVPGGVEVILDTSSASSRSTCENDQRTYCFRDVRLGIPAGAEQGEIEVTVIAVDDAGNRSDPATFTTTAACQPPPRKFISSNGERNRVLVLPDGRPAVVFTSGRRLNLAIRDGAGWNVEEVMALDSGHTFGLGIGAIVDESDGRPTVCLVDALLEDGQTEVTSTGTLRVLKRRGQGDWLSLGSLEGIRPIGCSLTNYEGNLAAGWVTSDPSSEFVIESLRSKAQWGRPVPFFGIFTIADIPRPEDSGDTRTAWDLSLFGTSERLHFAYRDIGSESFSDPIGAPGPIVMGFFEGADPQSAFFFGGPRQRGASPAILATESTVELALLDFGLAPFPGGSLDPPRLLWMRFPAPEDNGFPFPDPGFEIPQVVFADAPNEAPTLFPTGPVFNLAADGFTTVPEGVLPFVNLFSQPRLAANGSRVVLTYPRGGGSNLGGEALALVDSDIGGETQLSIVEARVGPARPGTHIITHDVALGPGGYNIAFYNPAPDHLAFAGEPANQLWAGAPVTECPEFWRTVELREDDLNLRYEADRRGLDVLADDTCNDQLSAIRFPVPFPLSAEPQVAIEQLGGDGNTFLQDLLVDVELRDGRGLLRAQPHVCLPNQEAGTLGAACVDNSEIEFSPVVENETTTAAVSSAGEVSGIVRTFFGLQLPTDDECPTPAQIVLDFSRSVDEVVSCVECPTGFFDPATDSCSTCPGEATVRYDREVVGVVPRTVIADFVGVDCRACPVQSEADLDRGAMPYVFSADGGLCQKCTAGSAPLPCGGDRDCEILGDNFRCAPPAAWANRPGAPETSVCLERCDSDIDCRLGSCDSSDGDNDGEPDGVCRRPDGEELASGFGLGCRPLGCDTCWKNDYCFEDEDCPLNHSCSGEFNPLAPLCIARPILSPSALGFAGGAIPEEVRELIARIVEQIQTAVSQVRLPVSVSILDSLRARIDDVRVRLIPRPEGMGQIRFHFDIQDTAVATSEDGGGLVIRVDDWDLEFVFEPHIRPRQSGARDGSFGGLDFALVDVDAEGLPFIPLVNVEGRVESTARAAAGGFASTALRRILDPLTALNNDGTAGPTRCIFVTSSPTDTDDLVRECPDGSSESEHLARIGDGTLDVVVRRCP